MAITVLFLFSWKGAELYSQQSHIAGNDTLQRRFVRPICKSYVVIRQDFSSLFLPAAFQVKKKPVRVNGNILYDLNYRSLLDTPIAARDFVQHFVQTNLSLLLFDEYPVQVLLSTRQSNSPYFRNYADISFRFDHQDFNRTIKERWQRSLEQRWNDHASQMNVALQSWQASEATLKGLQADIRKPAFIQKFIEAKEYLHNQRQDRVTNRVLSTFQPGADTTIKHKRSKFESKEEAQAVIEKYETNKSKVDSLEKEVAKRKTAYIKHKQQSERKLDSLKAALRSASNLSDLKKLWLDLYDSLTTKEKLLLGLQTFSIGRSPLNYSELSAKNISITGVNIEYSGRYYWAVAAGGVDYRFRDFVQRETRFPSQHLGLIRFGKGTPKGDHAIFTAYRGRKNSFGFSMPSSQQKVYGLTFESHYQLSPTQGVTFEVAKSSALSHAATGGERKTLFQLADPTTTAFATKYTATFPKTGTRLWGTYRYLGGNFQSFSLISNNANQHSWNIQLDQSLFERMVSLKASIRKNEWRNPYVSDYNSEAIFKSFFLSFRKRKLPSLSFSYMPASQLTNVGGSLYETYFQVLTATASHHYRIGRIGCQTLVSLSEYDQTGKDSAFLYAGSSNVMLSHLFTGKGWTATTTLSRSTTSGYQLSVVDQGLQVYAISGFSLGAGMKINTLNGVGVRTGYYTHLVLPIKTFGDLSLSYESSFLPGFGKALVPSDIGRATYYKRF